MDGSRQGRTDGWGAPVEPVLIASGSPMPGEFELAGLGVVADPSGALYVASERMLVVADLHLEKGSACARRGNLLPPYDTTATLARLAAVVAHYEPRCVVALGDSFHDDRGCDRLQAGDRARLHALQAGRSWIWLAGNHDRLAPRACGGRGSAELRLGDIVLRHLPGAGTVSEIAGHLHPTARVAGRAGSVRRRCFVAERRRCVMPAFGAYAGGLNLRDRAFAGLFGQGEVTAYVLGRHRVHAVASRHCLTDR